MYLNDVLTIPADLAGIPAVSVPCGFSDGLPVGLQVMGPSWREDLVLRVAAAYESMNDWTHDLLESRSVSIYGGTTEVQHGIVARQLLGLRDAR